jgi:hypothetical protein
MGLDGAELSCPGSSVVARYGKQWIVSEELLCLTGQDIHIPLCWF